MRTTGVLLMVVLLAGGGFPLSAQEASRYEEPLKQSLLLLERMAKALAAVKDNGSAEAARPELRKAAAELLEVRKKAAELPPPERAEKDRLAKEYKTKFVEAERKLRAEILRVGEIAGCSECREALREISGVLKKPES
jgi:hypothetical protein